MDYELDLFDGDSESETLSEIVQVAVAAAAIVLISSILTNVISVEFASAFASVVLTATLAAIYTAQTAVLERQTELAEGQNALMRAENRPIIDIEEFSFARLPERGKQSDGTIELSVLNHGNGPGINPKAYTTVDFEDPELEPATPHYPLRKSASTSKKNALVSGLSTLIPPTGEERIFKFPVRFGYKKDDELVDGYTHELLSDLQERGIESVHIELGISVQDLEEEWHDFTVLSGKVEFGNLPVTDGENSKTDFSFRAVCFEILTSTTEDVIGDTRHTRERTDKTELMSAVVLSDAVRESIREEDDT